MQFYAHHGNSREEREAGQRFEVDVEMSSSLRKAGLSDNLDDTYDYNRIYQVVAESMIESRFHLIEALAEHICCILLDEYPGAQVRVVVRKPHLPVAGVLDCAEVELIRGPVQDQPLNPE